jgi:integrase
LKRKKQHPMGLRERAGMWHYRFELNGEEYSGPTGLEAKQHLVNAALAVRAEERHRISRGGAVAPEIKPFNKAVSEFLDWCRGEYREHPSSASRIAGSMSSAVLFFGREPLGNINAGRCESFKTYRRGEHIKEITIRHDLHALSLLFQFGMKQGWCADNPVRGPKQGGLVQIPSDKDAVRIHVLTAEEEAIYFQAAQKVSKDLYDVGRIMILQGCRPEEVMALEQANVDLKAKTFRIAKGKSAAAKRTLDMYDETAWILRQRLRMMGRWVFQSPVKSGAHIAKLVNPHNRVLAETGLVFVPYDLRHTIATRWVESGIDLPTVAAWLGHSSLASIMKYVHIRPAHMHEAQTKYQEKLKSDGRSGFGPGAGMKTGESGL